MEPPRNPHPAQTSLAACQCYDVVLTANTTRKVANAAPENGQHGTGKRPTRHRETANAAG